MKPANKILDGLDVRHVAGPVVREALAQLANRNLPGRREARLTSVVNRALMRARLDPKDHPRTSEKARQLIREYVEHEVRRVFNQKHAVWRDDMTLRIYGDYD